MEPKAFVDGIILGIIAGIYIGWILYFVATQFGEWLAKKYYKSNTK